MMILHKKLSKELRERYQKLRAAGRFLPLDELDNYYTLFRQRFGPEQLQSLDGEALLYKMHGLGEEHRNGLVYWLEFKNDDQFPTPVFGSISGGSALKYGIYPRKEDGAWMTGSSHNLIEISVEEAIDVARRHREQLLYGVELLDGLPTGASDEAYDSLQETLNERTPDIVNSAWAHKYLHLLFPEKLDDYHVEHYQRFHLVRLLQVPPESDGRYVSAGRFVAVANELAMPMNHLTSLLNERNGRPYSYWRIGTKLGGERSIWDMMQREKEVAIGWPDIGDLSYVTYDRDSKESIRDTFGERYPNTPQMVGKKTQEIFNFVTRIEDGDIVLPSDGRRVLGIGRIIGEYKYAEGSDAPHRRPVEWLVLGEWEMPEAEGLRTTVFPVRKYNVNRVKVEQQILESPRSITVPPNGVQPLPRLTGVSGQIQSVLERKKQVILYGPPGTGKTYWARHAAHDLAAQHRFGKSFANLRNDQQQSLLKTAENSLALVRMCTFHPAYGYEDFLEGYRPQISGSQLVFERRDGIFKKLCQDAANHPNEPFYLIIDEINRGDIPRIFGELLTVLERDKRGQEILLPLSGQSFTVPENVYLIATMNTADRSIALLDTALRRRFGFIELMPDTSVLKGAVVANSIPLGPWLEALNQRILKHIGRDARNLQIGHAYLLEDGQAVTDFGRFVRILRDDIIPLLQEYCYEDYTALTKILGKSLVEDHKQLIRLELFLPEKRDDLVQALLAPAPELATAAEVVASEAESEELEEEEAELLTDEEEFTS